MKAMKMLTTGAVVLWLSACAGTGPVLYPNAHYQSVGDEVAEQDIAYCEQLAESAGARQGGGAAGNVAANTAMGAGVGAASGAVGGAITGSAGTGSLVGAASGAVWGLLRSIFYAARPAQPNQAYANFVSRCLSEKGYEVTGWQ
ncbi:Glycine-zipper containing OmpA-like membrane domain-containing protein [Nitrosomonas sp. Nm51]|uniref:glycine zipper family protein n=1 Tax=Nitrosomonas sp. Nm51 TaxID=133720 RepID=UPI0008B96A09|nr:glycine zipper family protein [Nitrosomonas sp. Nm51]SER71992.1 Glycine-zipper containing OmpA-like membrane domain-containing protein [Nitrosomonas sp. Nm51]